MSGVPQSNLTFPRTYKPQHRGQYDRSSAEQDSTHSAGPIKTSRSRSANRSDEKRPSLIRRLSRSRSRGHRAVDHARTRSGGSRTHRHALSNSSSIYSEEPDSKDPLPPRPPGLIVDNLQGNVSTIGLAVGSPSQLYPRKPEPSVRSFRPRMDPEPKVREAPDEGVATKAKGAKWKKIGGLFKAKNALMTDATPTPFYQLQTQYHAQPRNSSEGSLPSHRVESDPQGRDARFLFDNILASNGQLDPQRYVKDPVQKFYSSQRKFEGSSNNLDERIPGPRSKSTRAPGGLSLLDVEIPDVQMERYSVMFGSLLDNQGPSRLPKRERSSNDLLAIADEEEPLAEQEAPKPKPNQPSLGKSKSDATTSPLRLQPNSPYPRRATSPTPQPSPSFSLFPRVYQASEKATRSPLPERQGQMQRSLTAPTRLSPMQESFDTEQVTPVRTKEAKRQDKNTGSSLETASTSEPVIDSSNQSALSPASTRSSMDEDVLLDMSSLGSLKKRLNQAKTLGSLKNKLDSSRSLGSLKRKLDESEPMTDRDLKVLPLRPRHSEDAQSTTSPSTEVEEDSKPTAAPDMHQDTLAALERPRSPTSTARELSESLKPTKTRIDLIMQGASTKQDLGKKMEQFKPEEPERPSSPRSRQEVAIETEDVSQRGRSGSRGRRPIAASPAVTSSAPTERSHSARRPQIPVPDPGSGQARMQMNIQHEKSPPLETSLFAKDTSRDLELRRQGRQPFERPPQGFAEHRARTHQQIAYARQNGVLPQQPRTASHERNGPMTRLPLGNTTQITANLKPRGQGMRRENKLPSHYNSPNNMKANRPQTERRSTDREHDIILDLYLDDDSASKTVKKLQKRPSDPKKRPKKQTSPISKILPYPTPKLNPPEDPHLPPKSPFPISKYSSSGSTRMSPTATLSPTPRDASGRRRSHSSSSISPIERPLSAEERAQSPAVQAARRKAAQRTKDANSPGGLPSLHGHSHSTSSISTPTTPLVGVLLPSFSFTVQGPEAFSSQAGFYSHFTASSPNLPNMGRPRTPDLPQARPSTAVDSKRPDLQTSISTMSLPKEVETNIFSKPKSTNTNQPMSRPITPISRPTIGPRSASAAPGIHGSPPLNIHSHLRSSKGEKVMAVQAGVVPQIVDPGMDYGAMASRAKKGFLHTGPGAQAGLIDSDSAHGTSGMRLGAGQRNASYHRQERSVNLVIETA